jgi:catechol 2,3-dioxygenase-like lactoylglutathione lyase family enzyme
LLLKETAVSAITHVTIGSNDLAAARRFYDAVLGALKLPSLPAKSDSRLEYGYERPEFLVLTPADGKPATVANGGMVGFHAADPAAVRAFHAAGLASGGSCEGPPGPRPARPGLYVAYLRDPDGHKICAHTYEPEP